MKPWTLTLTLAKRSVKEPLLVLVPLRIRGATGVALNAFALVPR